ncbi:hypothetical protein PsYK624_062790 [Phanerochaete sordida]|uniref:Fungal N-terminal domain-containing protein n=1 Tax=Phanerochaete sordida TaxID=48140 RepID=A0A9P3GA44_9APHY|nr:hypothetical protein PsYK624_062790 [Phanerochaete sordida]
MAARDERRAQFYRQLLDHVIAASSVVAAVADGPLNIPMLKTVATCAKKIAELGQEVHANKDDCDKLVEKTTDYLNVLTEALGRKNVAIDAAFRRHIAQFADKLTETEYLLLNLASRSYWTRLLRNASDRRDIVKCQADLEHAFDRLHLAGIVHTAAQLHGISNEMSEMHLLVKRSTDDLRQQLAEVHRTVASRSNDNLSMTMPQAHHQPPAMYGPSRPPRPHYQNTQPIPHRPRPNLNLQISNAVARASLYRRLSTSPYSSPLSPARMLQLASTAVAGINDSTMLNLRNRREATAASDARARVLAAGKASAKQGALITGRPSVARADTVKKRMPREKDGSHGDGEETVPAETMRPGRLHYAL